MKTPITSTSVPIASGISNITVEQRLSELRSQQEGLAQQLNELQDAVKNNQILINVHENMLRPICALPTETLEMIFRHVVRFVAGDIHADPYPMSLTLASVCSRWRSIMCTNAGLWTNINLDQFYWSNLYSCFSRSGGSMLDISFHGGNRTKYHNTTKFKTLLHALGREAQRWRTIRVNAVHPTFNLTPLWTQKSAESLEVIHIVDQLNDRYHEETVQPIFAAHQKNLHTLILIHVHMLKALVAPNLKSFTFVDTPGNDESQLVHYDTLWCALAPATQLHTLRLGYDSISFVDDFDSKTITFSQLRHFTIYFTNRSFSNGSDGLAKLLDTVSAPALQVIELTSPENQCNYYPNKWQKLMSGETARYPTVTTAILYRVCSCTTHVKSFMKAFPNIANLVLDINTLVRCNDVLIQHNDAATSPPLRYWEKLECTEVHIPLDPHQSAYLEELQKWYTRREEMGLRSSRVKFFVNQRYPGPLNSSWESKDRKKQFIVYGETRSVGTLDDGHYAPWDLYSSC